MELSHVGKLVRRSLARRWREARRSLHLRGVVDSKSEEEADRLRVILRKEGVRHVRVDEHAKASEGHDVRHCDGHLRRVG